MSCAFEILASTSALALSRGRLGALIASWTKVVISYVVELGVQFALGVGHVKVKISEEGTGLDQELDGLLHILGRRGPQHYLQLALILKCCNCLLEDVLML